MTQRDLPFLGSLLGIDAAPNTTLPDVSPARLRVLLLDMLVRLTLAQARTAPLLFVFEDLHWINPTSLELLEALLDEIDHERILLLAPARPDGVILHGPLPQAPETVALLSSRPEMP